MWYAHSTSYIHCLFIFLVYQAYSFYSSTRKLPETLSQAPIVSEESDVSGWRTQSKPPFSRRKCLNEVTDRSSQKPQAFITHAAETTITIFGQSTTGRCGGGEVAKWMNRDYLSFLKARVSQCSLWRTEALLPSFSEELIIASRPALFHPLREKLQTPKKLKRMLSSLQIFLNGL